MMQPSMRVVASRPAGSGGTERGFTLLEIVVVVSIAALLFGLAALAIGVGSSRQLEVEGRRLVELASLARDESLLLGQTRALGLARTEYAFLERVRVDEDTITWVAVERAPFHARSLQRHGIELRLRQDGRVVPLDDRADLPQVFFDSAGGLTPFELELRRPGAGGDAVRITGTLSGHLSQERLR
jgi:general secretion pathway protein H